MSILTRVEQLLHTRAWLERYCRWGVESSSSIPAQGGLWLAHSVGVLFETPFAEAPIGQACNASTNIA